MLFSRAGRNSLGIIILYQMIARLVFLERKVLEPVLLFMAYPLNSYVDLLIFFNLVANV